STEFRVRHGDGHWLWMRDALAIDRDANGAVQHIRGVVVDVSREHDAAVALQQYADIVEHIQFSLFVWRLVDLDDDLSLTGVRANPAAMSMFGVSEEEIAGRRLVDLWPQPGTQTFASMIADVIRTKENRLVP